MLYKFIQTDTELDKLKLGSTPTIQPIFRAPVSVVSTVVRPFTPRGLGLAAVERNFTVY